MSDASFDLYVANKLTRKADNARTRGIEFSMTFQGMKNILNSKTCYYTGLPLTRPRPGEPLRASDLTIDRVDSSKGYVKGNVVACSHAANQLKAQVEGVGIAGFKMGIRVFEKSIKRINGGKK
jgi:hypothetical protein